MPDLSRLRQAAADGHTATAALNRQLAELVSTLAAERALLAKARAIGDADSTAAVRARISRLNATRDDLHRNMAQLHDELAGSLVGLLGNDITLEGDTPLVLLPVRIEVRSTADQTALRVRIFPDAVHVEALDEGIDERELAAGVAYWKQVWSSGDTQAPWPAMLTAVGARRAPWVAQAMRPLNLDARLGADPKFPQPPARSGNTAVVRTMPDRFYVRVEQDDAEPLTVHGAVIPDELPIGLRDEASLVPLKLDEFDMPPLDASMKWLADYAEAERVGMAVTVKLPFGGRPVRKLVVYGVRAGLPSAEGSERLERLIRSHRFTDGAEFLAQGTPTNNTESAMTSWSRRTPAGPPDIAGASAAAEGSNASVTASALGVSLAQMMTLPGATDVEQRRAAAFNTALWTTTWKEAVEHISQAGRNNGDKRLDIPELEAVRELWIDSVRGRGPLPALRLGRQPYGLLPVVMTDASWQPVHGGFVEERLVPFLHRSVRPFWNAAQSAVATITNRPLDTALPDILGTDAVLRTLRVRSAVPHGQIFNTAEAWVLPDLGQHKAQDQITETMNLVGGVEWGEVGSNDLLGKNTRTLALPLVHETDNQFILNLLASTPLPDAAPASVLQVLLAHAAEVERDNREKLVAPELKTTVREAINGLHLEDHTLLLDAYEAVQAQKFDDSSVEAAASALTKEVGRLDMRVLADRHPIPAFAPATILQQVAGEDPTIAIHRLSSKQGMQFIGEIFHAGQWSAKFRAALETIAGIDSADERRLLLSETLDCCSHRLDAWITAAASRRLRRMRQRGAGGAFIGAYGWLENIELRTPAPAGQVDEKDVLHDGGDGGFIHAPGLNQAATAAVLRSGRLTHRRGDPNNEALDIDLSSARVRDALSLLEGMRHGQSLGALLGYRLERRLHERSGHGVELDRFIYVLRTLAPLRAGKLTEPAQQVEESLAARDVVDGLKLMELAWSVIQAKLVIGPKDAPYIQPPQVWNAPTPAEADLVKAAIADLQSTHDAVADLLLAESVHQLVVGNPARAAATMDVLGAGEAVPPEPDVVRTPRAGITISHRIAILIAGTSTQPYRGWNADAPRSRAEPRLEAWAQGVLGDPAAIRIVSDNLKTLADAGLSALDVLYDADGDTVAGSTLGRRLRLTFELTDKELPLLAPVWELAAMLRARLAAGRALDVADLGFPVSEDEQRREPNSVEILDRAKTAKQELIAAAVTGSWEAMAPYGIRPAASSPTLDLSVDEQARALAAMVDEAQRRVSAAGQLLLRAEVAKPPAVIAELARQTIAVVFGAQFLALPLLGEAKNIGSDPWAKAAGPAGVGARPGADIRPWLARAGVLRPAVSMYGETLLVREAQGRPAHLRVVQTPADAYGTWAALPFPDRKPPKEPLRSMVAEVAGDPGTDLTGSLAGVVLDEWVEILPKRVEVGDLANETELKDVTTTGIALNANAPGARPPQAILIALSADGAAWNGERLAKVLDEALALAQIRGVTLDQLPYVGHYLPALYFRDWSLQGEPVINWAKITELFQDASIARYLKVDKL